LVRRRDLIEGNVISSGNFEVFKTDKERGRKTVKSSVVLC
jgi:hypothetical protein